MPLLQLDAAIGKSPTFSKKPLPTRLPQPCSATSTRALDVTLCQALQSRPLIDPDLLVCHPHACSCSHHNRSFRCRTFPHPGFLSLPGGISSSKLVGSRFICSMLLCGLTEALFHSFRRQGRRFSCRHSARRKWCVVFFHHRFSVLFIISTTGTNVNTPTSRKQETPLIKAAQCVRALALQPHLSIAILQIRPPASYSLPPGQVLFKRSMLQRNVLTRSTGTRRLTGRTHRASPPSR